MLDVVGFKKPSISQYIMYYSIMLHYKSNKAFVKFKQFILQFVKESSCIQKALQVICDSQVT